MVFACCDPASTTERGPKQINLTKENNMKRVDQMPTDGCGCCGKYEELSQGEKRKRLRWSGNEWLCAACLKGKELMESSPTA